MNTLKQWLTHHPIWLICMVGFLIRLLLYPFVQVNDADATTRILSSIEWLQNPTFISSGVWLPIHYYLTALPIFLFQDRVFGPIFIHVLFAVFTVFPIAKITERLFNRRGAILAACVYILSPVVMKDCYHALAGVPFAFFIAWSFYYLHKAVFDEANSLTSAALSGLFMTIAAGIRYEAWMLIAVFCLIIFINFRWKNLFAFFVIAMIFPVFWMIGNYIEYQDILYGIHGADYWNIQMEGVNDHLVTSEIKRRFFYFPLSWFLQQSIIPGIIVLAGIIYAVVTKQIYKKKYQFLLPFIGMLLIFSYKAVMGTLLTQHRFSIITILLSLPFVGILFEMPIKEIWKKTLLYCSVPLVFLLGWGNAVTFPIPRISNQESVKIAQRIKGEAKDKSLILDCFGWDNTFYVALYSRVPHQYIAITDCSLHGAVYKDDYLFPRLDANPEGFLILAGNKLEEEIEVLQPNLFAIKDYPQKLQVEKLEDANGLKLYKYKLLYGD